MAYVRRRAMRCSSRYTAGVNHPYSSLHLNCILLLVIGRYSSACTTLLPTSNLMALSSMSQNW